ncbi:MAG: carboxypeptidase regulatory-like domain-containing protein, partial [Desulfobacteraceae bacterium]|nr:carboxypeptidase regulatory-like domain-containing protein [Desulfobacteraceae bacterium]
LFHPDYCSAPVQAWPHFSVYNMVWTNPVRVLPVDKWCVFKDALGEPIPEATVEIFNGSSWEKRKPDSIGKIKLDEKGRLRPPESNPTLRSCCFIVSHPDYGTALVERRRERDLGEPLFSCTVPLVRIGTKADERSIWGTVVDPNGNPVAGAMITCVGVTVPSGGHIRFASTFPYQPLPLRTITDEQGHFALYLPIEKDSEKHGRLVPLASKYSVRIEAPKALGLEPYSGKINSGEETTITMVPIGHGKYFHTFVFEDVNGAIADPNRLRKIEITITYDKGQRRFRYDAWIDGGKFPLGTYKAQIPRTKPLKFEPIKVTEDSPELLVFKAQPGIIYRGQVVHGITGEPMPDAIVMSIRDGFVNDVSLLEPNQWDAICSVGPELDPQEPALAPLKEAFKFKKITQTDPKGSFDISFRPGEIGVRLVAVKKDYLGAAQKLSYFMPADETKTKTSEFEVAEPDGDGCITLPEMKLFPAGTIVIEPNVPTEAEEAGHDEVRLHWFTDPDDNTFWLSDLWATPKNNKGAYLFYKYDLRSNEIETAYIPAGLELTMRVYMLGESRWGPIIVNGIKLDQGQVLDLGRQSFKPAIKVSVKVIDSANEPVEGVAVRISNNISPWLIFMQGPITNEKGVVLINVPQDSKGEFVIEYYEDKKDPNKMHLREGTAYEVGGEEDAGREFTMT